VSLAALTLESPAALALVVLPVLLYVAARRYARERVETTGTVEIWRRVVESRPVAAPRARRGVPPWIRAACVALALGALALARPRPEVIADDTTLEIVVDRSPSMYLPMSPSGVATSWPASSSSGSTSSSSNPNPNPNANGAPARTRLDAALDAARAEIARRDPARVAWIDASAPGRREVGREMPREFARAPRVPRAEVEFAAHDRPGVLWITDRAPAVSPRHAGVSASGGGPVTGPVAARHDVWLTWDGTRLIERAGAEARARVRLDPRLPEPIVAVARIWAETRGVRVVETDEDMEREDVELDVRRGSPGAPRAALVGRDGWTARATVEGSAPTSDADGALDPWPTDVEGVDAGGGEIVTHGPGRVVIAMASMDEPRGDPAAFAVSWSRLLSQSLLAPVGCVGVDERADAGDAAWIAPRPTVARAGEESNWTAILAIAACVAAVWALTLRLSR